MGERSRETVRDIGSGINYQGKERGIWGEGELSKERNRYLLRGRRI